jgi:type II secretory pathway pseudopilin PulG
VEILVVTALIVAIAGMAVPQALAAVDRSRTWSAARYLASRMAVARTQAVMRSTNVALRFDRAGSGITFRMFADGNRNGVRSADIASGADPALGASTRLPDLFPGVDIAVTPAAGSIEPIRIGSSNLLSFTALGTATAGSIYIRGRDGLQLAVRIFGATGRTRIQRFEPQSGRWVDSF